MVRPQKCLRVDGIGPHTIKGNDTISNEFLCVIMVNPVVGMLEIKEISTVAIVRKLLGLQQLI